MKLSRALLVALNNLGANKMRSALTILGIVIGVAAVIAMLSIGRGVEVSITSRIEGMGTNLLFVYAGSRREHSAPSGPQLRSPSRTRRPSPARPLSSESLLRPAVGCRRCT